MDFLKQYDKFIRQTDSSQQLLGASILRGAKFVAKSVHSHSLQYDILSQQQDFLPSIAAQIAFRSIESLSSGNFAKCLVCHVSDDLISFAIQSQKTLRPEVQFLVSASVKIATNLVFEQRCGLMDAAVYGLS